MQYHHKAIIKLSSASSPILLCLEVLHYICCSISSKVVHHGSAGSDGDTGVAADIDRFDTETVRSLNL